ncbi:MAG: sugar phosphate isomerase/epimerase [Planctomycetes bacterium]|nr:sugar phosphate isomerase/epimerase [Planctomycetota bacterium]
MVTATSGVLLAESTPLRSEAAGPKKRVHIAGNQYPWFTYYRREKRDFSATRDESLAEVAKSGLDGFEPGVQSADSITKIAPLLKRHGLQMRSIYVGSVLHEPDQAEKSIREMLAIAEKAKSFGTEIIVTNPSPIRWGGQAVKTDEQLVFQAKTLDRLGAELRRRGLTLAYHNHDIELRNAAREFHHMLLATDPAHLSLCLDCHWIYRGSGNSNVALFDVLKLYGSRIVELHVRQSRDGIWTEVFSEGDIDYPAIVRYLKQIRVIPHVVLEQAVEKGTPHTMDGLAAHRRSIEYARKVFAPFAR